MAMKPQANSAPKFNYGKQGTAGKPIGKPFNETNLKNPSQPIRGIRGEQMPSKMTGGNESYGPNNDKLFSSLQGSSKRMNFPNGVIIPTLDVKQNVSNNPLKWNKKGK
jgi:hypothetical protein